MKKIKVAVSNLEVNTLQAVRVAGKKPAATRSAAGQQGGQGSQQGGGQKRDQGGDR